MERLKKGQTGKARVCVPDCSEELIVSSPPSIVIGYEIYDKQGSLVHGGSCAGELNCLVGIARGMKNDGYEVSVDTDVRCQFPKEYSQFEKALQAA